MLKKKKICVLVEAAGAASQYVQAFNERGFPCIHVQSKAEFLPFFKPYFKEELFLKNYAYDGNLDNLVNQLTDYDIQCVIAGMEPGVDLADQLSEKLNLLSNGTQQGRTRRDKYLMQQKLDEKGLSFIPSHKSDNLQSLLEWASQLNRWPLVFKPIDSAGCEGIRTCYFYQDIEKAYNSSIQNKNALGETNTKVMLQTFVNGTEFAVNSVSYDGQHFISDIWITKKIYLDDGRILYDWENLYVTNDEIRSALTAYHMKVLDALEIKHGPAHAEIMLTDSGPVLIEIGARMYGALKKDIFNLGLGHNQIDLTADVYTNPQKFLKYIDNPHQTQNSMGIVALWNLSPGVLMDLPYYEQAQKLKSHVSTSLRCKINDYLPLSTDVTSSQGLVYLLHHNAEVVRQDYEWLAQKRPLFFTTKAS